MKSNMVRLLSILKFSKQNLERNTRVLYKRITSTLLTYPERSFFTLIGLLFLVIILGSLIRKPTTSITSQIIPKKVHVFSIGKTPTITVSGKVEKSGVVKILAQTGGIVQAIYKTEGNSVRKGQTLFWLSTNYQGGTAPTVARQIAEKNALFANENYPRQKDLIQRRRDIAEKVNLQLEDLRNIMTESISETQATIDINEDVLSSLDAQIAYLEATNIGGANDALILQSKQGKAAVLAGLGSLKNALRNTQYQSGENNEAANIGNATKDLTLKQLEIEEKSLDLGLEIAKLNLTLSYISESLSYPASPVDGTIERIHVLPGTMVTPGQALATVTGNNQSAHIVVITTFDISSKVSRLEPSTIHIGSNSYSIPPTYISKEPTEGILHSILFSLPPDAMNNAKAGTSVLVDLSLGQAESSSILPVIPIDALYQTQNDSYVYIASMSGEGSWAAVSRKVTTETVLGGFVEIPEGLQKNDQIILDRTVQDGDSISISK